MSVSSIFHYVVVVGYTLAFIGDDSVGGWNPQPVRATIEFRGTQASFREFRKNGMEG